MINYLKERISLEELKKAVELKKPIEVLSLRDSWTLIEPHAYEDMSVEATLIKNYNNWNYKLKGRTHEKAT